MDEYPLVSLVITNWNGVNILKRCLDSINKYTIYSNYEVFVVDNNSTDGSIQLVEKDYYSWVKLIKNSKNISAPAATNQGIRASKGKYIIHLDNDVEFIEYGWLTKLVELAEKHNNVGIIGCKLLFPDGKIQHVGGWIKPASIGHYGYGKKDDGTYDGTYEVDYVTGAVFLMKRELIQKIGLWDEDFAPVYGDETDFCLRARKKGYKVFYTSKVVAIHHQSKTTKVNVNENYIMLRNKIQLILLNYPIRWIFVRFFYDLKLFIVAFFRGKGFILRAYWYNFKNIKKIIKKRKERSSRNL